MIHARNIALFIGGTILASLPSIRAQDTQPSETGIIPGRPLVSQNLQLTAERLLRFSPGAEPVTLAVTSTQDLSAYRGFRFGMDLPTVAKLARMRASDAKLVHGRPARIEELEWQPPFSSISPSKDDSVRQILFCFYNGSLFRMVVTYDPDRIEGLTDADMIEGISSKYGTATTPANKVHFFSAVDSYSHEGEKVIARWQDPQYSFNLFRSPYQSTFGMVAFSRRLDPLARAAVLEAVRLDAVEAPQREIDSQKVKDEEQADIRRANKPKFRP